MGVDSLIAEFDIQCPDPRAVPSDLPAWRLAVGGVSIGPMDLLIAAVGIVSTALLYAFLRITKLGFAVRATAQDRDAALQMGVNVNAVNSAVFAIASALGGLGGLLVGMYYNHIDPAMSFQATLKGVVAQVIGGVGNVPGATLGGAILGLTESQLGKPDRRRDGTDRHSALVLRRPGCRQQSRDLLDVPLGSLWSPRCRRGSSTRISAARCAPCARMR